MPKIAKRPPLVEEASNALLNDYRDVDWLPAERRLSEELGVSRTVVREAVKRLEMQGMLEVRHGVGVKVVRRLWQPIRVSLERELPDAAERRRQFQELRLWTEPNLAAQAARRAAKSDLRQLRVIHEDFAAAADYDELVGLDLQFHHQLADMAGNRVLALTLRSVGDLEEENRRMTLAKVGIDAARAHHQAILEAVEQGDPEVARQAMLLHLQAPGSA